MSIYGSDLRDSARCSPLPSAIVRTAEPRLTGGDGPHRELFAHAGRTSTQEQAWLLMAARRRLARPAAR